MYKVRYGHKRKIKTGEFGKRFKDRKKEKTRPGKHERERVGRTTTRRGSDE